MRLSGLNLAGATRDNLNRAGTGLGTATMMTLAFIETTLLADRRPTRPTTRRLKQTQISERESGCAACAPRRSAVGNAAGIPLDAGVDAARPQGQQRRVSQHIVDVRGWDQACQHSLTCSN